MKVNELLIYRDVAIYQSSFEDGGSKLKLTGYPMRGVMYRIFAFPGSISGSRNGTEVRAGTDKYTVEFSDFHVIKVENISNGSRERDVVRHDLQIVARRPRSETQFQARAPI